MNECIWDGGRKSEGKTVSCTNGRKENNKSLDGSCKKQR